LFFTYALSQFFTGAIGDMYPQKKVLTISFCIQAILFFFIGLAGSFELYSLWLYTPLFAIIGLVSSVEFPCLIRTLGEWT